MKTNRNHKREGQSTDNQSAFRAVDESNRIMGALFRLANELLLYIRLESVPDQPEHELKKLNHIMQLLDPADNREPFTDRLMRSYESRYPADPELNVTIDELNLTAI